ncbi:hypothetical protein HZA76_01910 [Candidatus Roizmanbacteria bacterium]|nr:hypothetical protein [Candidatus Roizmanbacteria bacterium]
MVENKSTKSKQQNRYEPSGLDDPDLLPPKHPKSGITRNYYSLFRIKLPSIQGGLNVDSLFYDRHSSHHSDRLDMKKSDLTHHVSLDLSSFVRLGLTNLKEGSPLIEKLSKVNQTILVWLEEWVDPRDSPNTDRKKPIYRQVSERIKKEAEKIKDPRTAEKFLYDWWDSLRFVRFLMAKGSIGSIMMNRQNGVDTSTLSSDLVDAVITNGLENRDLLSKLMKLRQGADLDFAVFPTDMYQMVFDEFIKLGILKETLGEKIININNLTGDEVEKFEVGEINEADIDLPPGYRLKSKKLICTFSSGRIKQKSTLPYRDIVYTTTIVNDSTGDEIDYRVAAMEFMPSIVDKTTVKEDSRTGISGALLSQMRASGIFLVAGNKKSSPTWLEPEDVKILDRTGFVVKLDNSFARALTLPDMPAGMRLHIMNTGENYDHSFVATILGRSLRDGMMNSLNIMTKDRYLSYPYTWEFEATFQNLAKLFKPERVATANREEMELGLMQAWILDFPFLISFLRMTGFNRHFVMGQNEEIWQALTEIAQKMERSFGFRSFLDRLIETKNESEKSGKPEKIDSENITDMVDQNITEVMELIRKDQRVPLFFKEGKSDIELMSALLSMPVFRELPREKAWGSDLEVNVIDSYNLKQHLLEESERMGKPIFGYRFYEAGSSFTYHMSRYPRSKKYSLGTPEEYEETVSNIEKAMKLKESAKDKPAAERRFRIVLGLNEGYSINRKMPREELKKFLGDRFTYKSGQVITVNNIPLFERPIYQEDALIIEGDIEDMDRVFQAADLTGQERFAVELLDIQEAYIVETRHCTYSDLEFKEAEKTDMTIDIPILASLPKSNSS